MPLFLNVCLLWVDEILVADKHDEITDRKVRRKGKRTHSWEGFHSSIGKNKCFYTKNQNKIKMFVFIGNPAGYSIMTAGLPIN